MRKFFLFLVLILTLLSSCNAEGKSFEKDQLNLFLESLQENNFTVIYTYDEMFQGNVVTYVEYKFYINQDTIYREATSRQVGMSYPDIKTYVYSTIENNKYYEYMYQVDERGIGPALTNVKEEVNETVFIKSIEYGKDFIFPTFAQFKYNTKTELYTYKTFTIKILGSKIEVYNTENNLKATYSNIGTTSISKPKYVKEYKKEIIEY